MNDYPATMAEIAETQDHAYRSVVENRPIEVCPYLTATDDKQRFLRRVWTTAYRQRQHLVDEEGEVAREFVVDGPVIGECPGQCGGDPIETRSVIVWTKDCDGRSIPWHEECWDTAHGE